MDVVVETLVTHWVFGSHVLMPHLTPNILYFPQFVMTYKNQMTSMPFVTGTCMIDIVSMDITA